MHTTGGTAMPNASGPPWQGGAVNCPHSPANCRCYQHELGLTRYAPDVVVYLEALAQTDRPRPRHLAAVPIPVIKAHPFGDQKDRQPWEPRPARKRAA